MMQGMDAARGWKLMFVPIPYEWPFFHSRGLGNLISGNPVWIGFDPVFFRDGKRFATFTSRAPSARGPGISAHGSERQEHTDEEYRIWLGAGLITRQPRLKNPGHSNDRFLGCFSSPVMALGGLLPGTGHASSSQRCFVRGKGSLFPFLLFSPGSPRKARGKPLPDLIRWLPCSPIRLASCEVRDT